MREFSLVMLSIIVGISAGIFLSEAERRADESEKRARDAEAQVAMLKSLLVGRAA